MGGLGSGNRTGNQVGRPKTYNDGRKQATIRVRADLWDEFLIKARRQKSSGSVIINSFIEKYMGVKSQK